VPELVAGSYAPIAAQGDLLIYRRQTETDALVILLNFGDQPISIASEAAGLAGEILISTFLDRHGEKVKDAVDLRGNEGVIIGALSVQPE
jgi:alpha-glucosidase